ncbi:MAG: hypothetical protein SVY15_04080 [Halobacteriota archaeon]|nr:hypothetical protein [Halobacteriota archaeon]
MPNYKNVGSMLILMSIGIYILAATLPGAIDAIVNTTTTNWGAGEKSLWVLLPLVFIAVVIMIFMPSIVTISKPHSELKHLKKWER